jgi:NifU-like protein involved in Fe-S cluster formation
MRMSVYSEILLKHAREPVGFDERLAMILPLVKVEQMPSLSDGAGDGEPGSDLAARDSTRFASGYTASNFTEFRNRSCGDVVRLKCEVEQGMIRHVTHHAEGCMLCKASASILCSSVTGLSVSDAQALIKTAFKLTDFREPAPSMPELDVDIGSGVSTDFSALAEVRQFPTRRKCMSLAWEALDSVLRS